MGGTSSTTDGGATITDAERSWIQSEVAHGQPCADLDHADNLAQYVYCYSDCTTSTPRKKPVDLCKKFDDRQPASDEYAE